MTEQQQPPEHSGSMENDPTGMHLPETTSYLAGTNDLDGDLGAAARHLVAALNPHPAQLATVDRIVAAFARRVDDVETVIALRYAIETAISRASAQPMMPPRGDQQGERVTGRAEPAVEWFKFCGFQSMHPAHTYESGTLLRRCLGMDASGPRGPLS